MTKRKHDYQYYRDVERAAFAESLRARGFITGEMRGSVASSSPGSTWSIPIESPKATLELLASLMKKDEAGQT
jgi:hypothetical protein